MSLNSILLAAVVALSALRRAESWIYFAHESETEPTFSPLIWLTDYEEAAHCWWQNEGEGTCPAVPTALDPNDQGAAAMKDKYARVLHLLGVQWAQGKLLGNKFAEFDVALLVYPFGWHRNNSNTSTEQMGQQKDYYHHAVKYPVQPPPRISAACSSDASKRSSKGARIA